MCNPLVPALLLLVAPLAYFAHRLGWLSSTITRRAAIGFVTAVVVLRLPFRDIGAVYVDRMKLLLAAWMALLLMLRWLRVPWWMDPARYRTALFASAAAAVILYLHLFAWLGDRPFLHHHEWIHYYLGSKYFPELGYGRLYVALLEAERQTTGRVEATIARDLETNAVVPVDTLWTRARDAHARFTPERWEAFRVDAAFLRERMGGSYPMVLQDHGFNPTPVWASIGGRIANATGPASHRTIAVLATLDPILIVATCLLLLTFGLETALVSFIYFSLIWGTSLGWLGGAYLRHMWIAAVVGAAASAHRGRSAAAGGLLAFASMLRVFPALLAAGLCFKAMWAELEGTAAERRRYRRLLAAAGLVSAALFAVTLLPPGGLRDWSEFARNLSVHSESLSTNTVGLTSFLAYASGGELTDAGVLAALFRWRRMVYALQLAILVPLALVCVGAASRRIDDVSAMALGSLLIVTGVTLTGYYWTFLVLLALAHRDRPDKLSLLFLVELGSYVLALFEVHDVVLYLYRGPLVLYLIVALYLDDFRLGARWLRHRIPTPWRTASA